MFAPSFCFEVVTSIDIQSIEPVDTRMRDSLMKSVQMAIEIATRYVMLLIWKC